MGYAQVRSVGLTGLTGHVLTVEADVSNGLPNLFLTGLPDAVLTEARDRVRAAVVNSGQRWPSTRITVNLLPADLPKHGSGFDLAVAAAVLGAAEVIPTGAFDGVVLLGELGLDGRVRPIRGILPAVVAAVRAGLRRVVVPVGNAQEASLVPDVDVRSVETLRRLVDFARGTASLLGVAPPGPDDRPPPPDLGDVLGQDRGRRAVELAAAGRHHLALYGPPGSGKTMLAQRLPSVLPELSAEESLEVTALHSIAGALPAGAGLIRHPPFQSPHHTASAAALVGGGTGLARPGSLSLAHHGILFLDEAPEFGGKALDALRQPIEAGEVVLRRARGEAVYPCRIQLVLAANPCPCASSAGDQHCQCSSLIRRRYLNRISGPLLDRIDLRVTLAPVTAAALLAEGVVSEPSALVAKRVLQARAAAAERWAPHGWRTNADVPGPMLRQRPYRLPLAVTAELTSLLDRGVVSVRGFDRVLRTAWSIVDIDGGSRPRKGDINEAIDLREGTPR